MRSLVKASIPVSITRLDSILVARRIALATDRVAQRKKVHGELVTRLA